MYFQLTFRTVGHGFNTVRRTAVISTRKRRIERRIVCWHFRWATSFAILAFSFSFSLTKITLVMMTSGPSSVYAVDSTSGPITDPPPDILHCGRHQRTYHVCDILPYMNYWVGCDKDEKRIVSWKQYSEERNEFSVQTDWDSTECHDQQYQIRYLYQVYTDRSILRFMLSGFTVRLMGRKQICVELMVCMWNV